MVKLTRIYTKMGDDGTTGLGSGERVRKDSIRVEAYAQVDEANAAIGVAIAGLGAGHVLGPILAAIQQDLFDLGADLCIPIAAGEAPGSKLRIRPEQTQRLEKLIDAHNEPLGPLTSFILPGGTAGAAALHMARTIVRRAERVVVTLLDREGPTTSPECLRYLNRLSDLLFVLARVANGGKDVLWIPGIDRR